MTPDRDPSRPGAWLRRARSNLARARAHRGLPEVVYEDLCFDAQQAAEKALKAVLVHRRIALPKTHAIAELITLLESSGLEVPGNVRCATALTPYAVEARYPGLWEEVTPAEYEDALRSADTVLRWAEAVIDRAE